MRTNVLYWQENSLRKNQAPEIIMAQTCNNSYQTEKNKKKSEKSESMLNLLFPLQRQWCSLEDTTNTSAEKEDCCTRMYVHFQEFLSDAIFWFFSICTDFGVFYLWILKLLKDNQIRSFYLVHLMPTTNFTKLEFLFIYFLSIFTR